VGCQGLEPLESGIRLDCTTFSYGERTIVSGLSGVVPLGKVVVVEGTPGLGSSTLLRLLSGTLSPNSGKLILPPFLKVALVDGSLDCLPYCTLRENIGLDAAPWVNNQDVDLLIDAFRMCWSGDHDKLKGDMVLDHLTSRMNLIVQLMRALLSDPDLLLANLKSLPMDKLSANVLGVLCIWQRSGLLGLLNVLREQRQQNTDGKLEFNDIAAMLRAEGLFYSRQFQTRPRTLVLLPSSPDLIQRSLISEAMQLRLVDHSNCVVEPYRNTLEPNSAIYQARRAELSDLTCKRAELDCKRTELDTRIVKLQGFVNKGCAQNGSPAEVERQYESSLDRVFEFGGSVISI